MLLAAGLMYFVEKKNSFSCKYSKQATVVIPDARFKARLQILVDSSREPYKEAGCQLFHVFFSMFVTFIVFPGVNCSANLQFIDSFAWFSLLIVTIFNIFDTIGRFIGGFPSLQVDSKGTHAVGFGRLLIVASSIALLSA